MKIPKWQHKFARYYKRGKLVSYFLNNAAKTCLYGLKISKNIEIGHFFQSRAFFHLSSNLHTSCLSAFKEITYLKRYYNYFDSKVSSFVSSKLIRQEIEEIFHDMKMKLSKHNKFYEIKLSTLNAEKNKYLFWKRLKILKKTLKLFMTILIDSDEEYLSSIKSLAV